MAMDLLGKYILFSSGRAVNPRRDILLFDHIAIPSIGNYIKYAELQDGAKSSIRDIEYLIDKGIVFDGIDALKWLGEPEDNNVKDKKDIEILNLGIKILKDTTGKFENILSVLNEEDMMKLRFIVDKMAIKKDHIIYNADEDKMNDLNDIIKRYDIDIDELSEVTEEFHGEVADILCRISAMIGSKYRGLDSYAKVSSVSTSVAMDSMVKSKVVDVVLKRLPIPPDNLPWEAIEDFRSDRDTIGKYWNLRKWISSISKSEMKIGEIKEELETLIFEYENNIKLHKMKYKYGAMRLILSAGAGFIGNASRLKWAEAMDSVFEVKDRSARLFESEISAQGKEIAFIVKANESF